MSIRRLGKNVSTDTDILLILILIFKVQRKTPKFIKSDPPYYLLWQLLKLLYYRVHLYAIFNLCRHVFL